MYSWDNVQVKVLTDLKTDHFRSLSCHILGVVSLRFHLLNTHFNISVIKGLLVVL